VNSVAGLLRQQDCLEIAARRHGLSVD
jgi:hypothetical protein